MIESILITRQLSVQKRVTVLGLISAGLVALAVILPQMVHVAIGMTGGVKWLPMYLPVLIGGCILGVRWGMVVGVASPLVSYLLTSMSGSPMPALERLPFMMVELAVFALVAGAFSGRIIGKPLLAFPAVWCAQVIGRGVFLGIVALTQSFAQLAPQMVWQQIRAGWSGLLVQAILVPALVISLRQVLVEQHS